MRSETILLAEDDRPVRELTATVLQNFGYTVIEAVDGEDAVKQFMENKDRVRLLIFDVIMPKKNRKEACNEIQACLPGNQSPVPERIHGEPCPQERRPREWCEFPHEAHTGKQPAQESARAAGRLKARKQERMQDTRCKLPAKEVLDAPSRVNPASGIIHHVFPLLLKKSPNFISIFRIWATIQSTTT